MLHGLWRVFVVSGDMWCTGVMLLARGEFLFVVLVNEAMRDLWLCVPGCAACGVWHVDDDGTCVCGTVWDEREFVVEAVQGNGPFGDAAVGGAELAQRRAAQLAQRRAEEISHEERCEAWRRSLDWGVCFGT